MKKWRRKNVATVYCNGGDHSTKLFDYDETITDCQMALEKHPDGNRECTYGCIGLGSCVAKCKFGAIEINEMGVAVIDPEKCIGCKLCVKSCPKNIISMRYEDQPITPLCSNKDPGPAARKKCSVSCISCKMCEKACPAGAILVEENFAIIDNDKCLSCGACLMKCPRKLISDQHRIFNA